MEYHYTEKEQEKLILVGLENDLGPVDTTQSMDELEELVKTSGAVVCDRITQKRDVPHRGHYVGKGKIDEIKDLISLHDAQGIVCDDELSNGQIRNLSEALDTKVLDRTLLILDIFAGRAQSAEGKAQVELAQLKYRMSHLSGVGKSMSRLGGGIGTRGPGEKKLETDRRHIRKRVSDLEGELRDIESHRKVLRDKRAKDSTIVVSLVGYTNAGKSTLLNFLTGADAYACDQLFATLDTTSRKLVLSGASQVILTDTVGFIQKLPHHLIKAFRATLDELKYADIIVHVIDGSNPHREDQMRVVYETMDQLECGDKPVITAFNKMDLEVQKPLPGDNRSRKTVQISAKTGLGKEELLSAIEDVLKSMRNYITALIPYTEGGLLNSVKQTGEILEERYEEHGVYVEAYVNAEMYNRTIPFHKN